MKNAHPKTIEKRRALGYSRVSTTAQLDGESLDVQRAHLEALCVLNNLALHAVYEEQAVSGAKPFLSRPEGAKLWAEAKRGDVVVVLKLDRLTRSPRDALSILDECRKRGIGLVVADMGLGDVTHGATAAMLVGILSSVAGFERARNGERVAEVKAMQRAQGRYTGGAVPFGFTLVQDGDSQLVQADWALQTRLFDLKRRNYSARAMVGVLRAEGHQVSNVTLSKFFRTHVAA
jgi:DNA invertase Pin-like site-specific DNA recombinase